MNTFAILYAAASIASIVACLPQIVQILRTKNVEGISLETYDMWFIFQIMALPYAIQSGDIVWIAAGLMWASYYVTMVVLIEHYRYPHYIRFILDKVAAVLRIVPVHVR